MDYKFLKIYNINYETPTNITKKELFYNLIYILINDIILTLEECIFTPYSSQRRAVSSKLRSASAGDWPLKIKLNNFVNRSIETVPEIKISIFLTTNISTQIQRRAVLILVSGFLVLCRLFFSKSAISNRAYLLKSGILGQNIVRLYSTFHQGGCCYNLD